MPVNLAIDFDWSRGRAYEIVVPPLRRAKKDPFALSVDEPHVTQTGDAFDPMRPLEAHPDLFMDFAKLNGSAEACADFAGKWGLLEKRANAGGIIQERLSFWRKRIEIMRLSIDGLKRAFEEKHPMAMRGENIAPLDLKLVPGKPMAGQRSFSNLKPCGGRCACSLLNKLQAETRFTNVSGAAIPL